MASLEVTIGADSSDLTEELNKVERQLRTLENRREVRIRAGLDIGDLERRVNETRTRLDGLRDSVNDAANAVAGSSTRIASGSNALMQFSRIAQDAPYGIIGIGNNITATVEAFGHLRESTGSAGGALRAMAGSIMGSGGILLAVSLVTTAFTYMSQNGLTLGDVIDKMTGNFDEAAASMAKLRTESAKNAGQEISEIKAYVSIAKNRNLSDEKRIIAVDELQRRYPVYFGNLSKEQILNGNVATAVRDVTSALRNKALAQAYSGKAGEFASKEVELRDKEAGLIQDSKNALLKLNQAKKEGNDIDRRALILKSYQLQLKDVQQEIKSTISEIDKYQKKQNEFSSKAIGLEQPPTKPAGGGGKGGATTLKAVQKRDQFASDPTSQTALGMFSAQMEVPPINGEKAIQSLKDFNLRAGTEFNLFDKLAEDFNIQLSGIVTNGTVDALTGIGESLGTALASGGNVIDAVGKSILGSMGSMLKDLGKATIAYGVGLIAVKAAIKNPYLAVAAGVAMVALGSAMSTAVSKSSSTALGGGSGGGGSVQGGNSYSSPSLSNSGGGGGSFSGGTVVFEISGQTLVGVLSNTLDRNRRLGGALVL